MKLKQRYDIMNMARQAHDGTIDEQVRLILEDFPKGQANENSITQCEQRIEKLIDIYRTGVQEQKYYPTDEDTNALTILFNEAQRNCTNAKDERNTIQKLLKAGIIIQTIEHALKLLTTPIDDRLEQKENMQDKTETRYTLTKTNTAIRYTWK